MNDIMSAVLALGNAVDEFIVVGALLMAVATLARSYVYRNAFALRMLKFALVIGLTMSHFWLIAFSPQLTPSSRGGLMETELVVSAVYMLVNGIEAFALMIDKRKKSGHHSDSH